MKNLSALLIVISLFFFNRASYAQDSMNVHILSHIASGGTPADVWVSGGIAYMCARPAGMKIANVSNPSSPEVLSTFGMNTYWANHCEVHGDYCAIGNSEAGLRIVDVSSLESPEQASLLSLTTFVSDVDYEPPYAYAATYTRGLIVVDCSDPSSPNYVSSCSLPGSGFTLEYRGQVAFVADGTSGLQIVSVSDPENPFIMGSCALPGNAYRVALYGKYCYVADGSAGVHIVDITDLYQPIDVGTIQTSGLANHDYILGQYLYVAEYSAGISIYYLGNPLQPVLTGRYRNGGYIHTITAWSNYAIVSNTSGWFNILDCSDAIGQTSAVKSSEPLPDICELSAYPNPTNGEVIITGLVPTFEHNKSIRVFDSVGREVIQANLSSLLRTGGRFSWIWDTRSSSGNFVPSGSYFAKVGVASKALPIKIVR